MYKKEKLMKAWKILLLILNKNYVKMNCLNLEEKRKKIKKNKKKIARAVKVVKAVIVKMMINDYYID